jgi:hypothetical protein
MSETGPIGGEGIAPGRVTPRKVKRAGVACLVVLLAAGGGEGGYRVGLNGGEDLRAARAAGTREGKREQERRDARMGYLDGFKRGRRAGYERAYRRAYSRVYKQAFKKKGLPVPRDVNLP